MEAAQPASKKAKSTNRGTWSRSFAEVVKDRKIIGVIDQSDEGGRLPRNQRGLVRRALASVALKVLDENSGPPSDCTDAGWYQGNVNLIDCEDKRSAALYKAAINKRVTMNVVILLNQACLEPLAAQQNRLNYGFDKMQLRI